MGPECSSKFSTPKVLRPLPGIHSPPRGPGALTPAWHVFLFCCTLRHDLHFLGLFSLSLFFVPRFSGVLGSQKEDVQEELIHILCLEMSLFSPLCWWVV